MHTSLVKNHGAGCSGFVCDNSKLSEMIGKIARGENRESYLNELDKVRSGSRQEAKQAVQLEKEEPAKKTLKDTVTTPWHWMMLGLVVIGLSGGALLWGLWNRRKG